jgi:fructokinase
MDHQDPSTQPPIVVSLGEALFDCFPDRAILGGAPLNFLVHLQQLFGSRGRGVLVSRVGRDDLGRQVIEQVTERGVDARHIQLDDHRPTGTVQVSLSPTGEPSYAILENVAWDYIEWNDVLEQLSAGCAAICFGTLAQRSATNRETFAGCLAAARNAIRLLDVNLRQHFITPHVMESSLLAANVVKLNDGELSRIVELLPRYFRDAFSIDDQVNSLRNEFGVRLVALTRGEKGTVLYCEEGRFEAEPVSLPPSSNADGVGAGDACCAGLLYGLLNDWPPDLTLRLANHMGAYVASQPGGTPRLPQSLLDLARAT